MEAVCSSKTLAYSQDTIWRINPANHRLYSHSREKQNSYILQLVVFPHINKKSNLCAGLHVQGYSKRSIHIQKFILQKLLVLNPCPVYGWKGNLSKF
jgi:hypothetical protein